MNFAWVSTNESITCYLDSQFLSRNIILCNSVIEKIDSLSLNMGYWTMAIWPQDGHEDFRGILLTKSRQPASAVTSQKSGRGRQATQASLRAILLDQSVIEE